MSVNFTTIIFVMGCAFVTIIPRIIPFLGIRNIALPEQLLKWLSYVPICILTALMVKNFIIQTKQLKIDWSVIAVLIPTLLIAIKTRSLSITVISGVVLMAALRYFYLITNHTIIKKV